MSVEEIEDIFVEVTVEAWSEESSFVRAEISKYRFDWTIVSDIALSAPRDQDFCADAISFFEDSDLFAEICSR